MNIQSVTRCQFEEFISLPPILERSVEVRALLVAEGGRFLGMLTHVQMTGSWGYVLLARGQWGEYEILDLRRNLPSRQTASSQVATLMGGLENRERVGAAGDSHPSLHLEKGKRDLNCARIHPL